MEAYTGFAQVYDQFMDNIDYGKWCQYIQSILSEYEITEGIVLDLGCGTGKITRLLSNAGYDMIGIDSSQDMLNVAMEQRGDDQSILYLNQDMREIELYGTVAAMVSVCDSINYITDYTDLVKVFRLVNNYLDPKGIFIFDIKTMHYYKEIGDAVIAEDREDCSFIWDNEYDQESHMNAYTLSLFVRAQDGRYDKYIEEHYQRAYRIEEIKAAIQDAGLEFLAAYNAFTREDARENCDRIYFIVRENGK